MDERTAQYLGQIHKVSVVYNIYRIVLPLVLLVSSLGPSPTLFIQACTAYALFGVAASFFIPIGTHVLKSSYILTITLLTYSSGGMINELGLLLIMTANSVSILIRGRISMFLTAAAALSLIYSELCLTLSADSSANQFVQTGTLGAILFVTSFYILRPPALL